MPRRLRVFLSTLASLALALYALGQGPARALDVETLRAVGGLPAHIVSLFGEASDFQQAGSGDYFVFDRREHAVYTVDRARSVARRVLEIGQEAGRIIEPSAFDVAENGVFAVADAPRGRERIQLFGPGGRRLGGFTLPGRLGARVVLGNWVLNGVGSLAFTGATFLISHPESGGLFTEYSGSGAPLRNIGRLRDTGHEEDRAVHVAMNAGLPLVDPRGGFYYVFLTGTPMFRKYDARGALLFERHIEGPELDAYVAAIPDRWPTRHAQGRDVPFVAPAIRTAGVDPNGRLWVSLVSPYTYVYDEDGDKTRTVQFQAAGILSPTSLFFGQGGRLLVTPGCYIFDPDRVSPARPDAMSPATPPPSVR